MDHPHYGCAAHRTWHWLPYRYARTAEDTDERARMSMHAYKDECSRAPVVSLSLGATCLFRFGNAQSRGRPWTDIELASGDLFVFGGPARLAYHGVPRTMPGTEVPGIGLPSGRLNVTVRESGLG